MAITVPRTVDLLGNLTTVQIGAATAVFKLYTDAALTSLVAGSTVNLANVSGRFTGTLSYTVTATLVEGTDYYGEIIITANDGVNDIKTTIKMDLTADYKEG